jgi:integrase
MTSQRGTVERHKRFGSWGYRLSYVDDMGKRRWATKYSKRWTKADAQRELTRQLSLVDRGHNLGTAQSTVQEYLRDWFARWQVQGNVKQSTIDTARVHLDVYLLPRIGHLRLRDLKRARIGALYQDLLENGRTGAGGRQTPARRLSAKTVRNIAGTLHKALDDAVRLEILQTNPADNVDLPKWERPELQTWDSSQLAQFLTWCADNNDPLLALWRLLAVSGLRRGELLGLTWNDVDLVMGEIRVRQTRVVTGTGQVRVETPKTAAGRRVVTIDPGTVDALARLKDDQERAAAALGGWTSLYVATTQDGQPIYPKRLTDRFQAAAKAAGVPVIRLHDGRHSNVTLAIESGVPVAVMSSRVGHSRPSTTSDIYFHRHRQADVDAGLVIAARIDAAIQSHRDAQQKSHKSRTQPDEKVRPDANTTNNDPIQDKGLRTSHDETMVRPLGIEPRTCGLRVRCSTS